MDTSSYFINGKALFGSHPTQDAVNILEEHGVRYFINLTYKDEKKITPYTTKYNYISFPIRDGGIPDDKYAFISFIFKLHDIIKQLKYSELIYIHCKGGHGRSGVVVSCLMSTIFKLSPVKAIEHTTRCHSNRLTMRDVWRKIGSPQSLIQKQFIYNICRSIVICKKNILHPDHQLYITYDNIEFPCLGKLIQYMTENSIPDPITNAIDLYVNEYPIIKTKLIDTYSRHIKIYGISSLNTDDIIGILTDLRMKHYTEMF